MVTGNGDRKVALERLRDTQVHRTTYVSPRTGNQFTVARCRGWTRDELIEYLSLTGEAS
jgi:hypothetical protein